jgi:Predicted molecular chaperone distantly related to HSP70-fold metalloproteases
MTKNLYLGVMSGTSVDAIDIVAVKIFDGSFNFIDAKSFQFEPKLRKEVLKLSRNSSELDDAELKIADQKLANAYGKAINEFLSNSQINTNDIVAVGLHGQTFFTNPC